MGLMFGSIAGALVSLLQNFANPDALKLFIVWTLGSLSSVGWSDMQLLIPILLLGAIFVILALKPLNGLLLGEDYARGLGINVSRTRLFIVLATGLLAGGVTAFCGPIAFIGVAAYRTRYIPHVQSSYYCACVRTLGRMSAAGLRCALLAFHLPVAHFHRFRPLRRAGYHLDYSQK